MCTYTIYYVQDVYSKLIKNSLIFHTYIKEILQNSRFFMFLQRVDNLTYKANNTYIYTHTFNKNINYDIYSSM